MTTWDYEFVFPFCKSQLKVDQSPVQSSIHLRVFLVRWVFRDECAMRRSSSSSSLFCFFLARREQNSIASDANCFINKRNDWRHHLKKNRTTITGVLRFISSTKDQEKKTASSNGSRALALIAYRSAPCHSITTPPWLSFFFFFFWLWNNLCKSFVQVTFGRCPIDQCWAMRIQTGTFKIVLVCWWGLWIIAIRVRLFWARRASLRISSAHQIYASSSRICPFKSIDMLQSRRLSRRWWWRDGRCKNWKWLGVDWPWRERRRRRRKSRKRAIISTAHLMCTMFKLFLAVGLLHAIERTALTFSIYIAQSLFLSLLFFCVHFPVL